RVDEEQRHTDAAIKSPRRLGIKYRIDMRHHHTADSDGTHQVKVGQVFAASRRGLPTARVGDCCHHLWYLVAWRVQSRLLAISVGQGLDDNSAVLAQSVTLRFTSRSP